MERIKVSEWVDINTPREQVFALVTHIERRMQLSPLWGIAKVTTHSGEYPAVGSGYMIHLTQGEAQDYGTVVTEYTPPSKFSYCLDVDLLTEVSWTLQSTPRGTRLTYTEDFIPPEGNPEEFAQAVRKTIKEWLNNLKRYSELKPRGLEGLLRLGLDRFFLRLRPDQRQVVAMILFLQGVTALTFVLAAVGMGIVSLFMP